MLYFLVNGLDLSGTVTAAYYKIIGEAAHLACVQQDDVSCLFLAGRFHRQLGYFNTFQVNPLRFLHYSIAEGFPALSGR